MPGHLESARRSGLMSNRPAWLPKPAWAAPEPRQQEIQPEPNPPTAARRYNGNGVIDRQGGCRRSREPQVDDPGDPGDGGPATHHPGRSSRTVRPGNPGFHLLARPARLILPDHRFHSVRLILPDISFYSKSLLLQFVSGHQDEGRVWRRRCFLPGAVNLPDHARCLYLDNPDETVGYYS